MRLYTFTLTQLRQPHQGIQMTHILGDMIAKYVGSTSEPVDKFNMLIDWATNHKTLIAYDGGFAANLQATRTALLACPYPWAEFFEDEETFYGIMTSVGVILPAKVYEAADFVRNGGVLPGPSASGKIFFESHVLTLWDVEFINNVLIKTRMAT